MANIVTTTNSESSINSTQNPQSIAQSSSINGSTKNIQNSVDSSTLNTTSTSQGIRLSNQSATPVNLSGSSSQATVSKAETPKAHHLNPLAVTLVIILVVVAVSIFIGMNRAAKSTTKY